MQSGVLNIACVDANNYQGRGVEYVNKLHYMVRTNITVPFRFICLSNYPAEYDESVIRKEIRSALRGWWNKLYLFKQGVFSGRVLFFDLDTIILKNIDDVAQYSGKLAILQDFLSPHKLGSAIMAWEADTLTHIWDDWIAAGKPEVADGDQTWIQQKQPIADLWQTLYNGLYSYKRDCRFGVPPDARIICFHGKPRPHHFDSGWVREKWGRHGKSSWKASG